MMNWFRNPYTQKPLLFFAGVFFLNMSFFLAEVSVLKLDHKNEMIGNIARLICNGGLEEEKECSSDSSEGNSTIKEIDFHISYLAGHSYVLLASLKLKKTASYYFFSNVFHTEIVSPPPEKNRC
jgi:hypothetical protein